MRSIEVETAFDTCNKCRMCKLETTEFTTCDGEVVAFYRCEYECICENAVEIWKAERAEE